MRNSRVNALSLTHENFEMFTWPYPLFRIFSDRRHVLFGVSVDPDPPDSSGIQFPRLDPEKQKNPERPCGIGRRGGTRLKNRRKLYERRLKTQRLAVDKSPRNSLLRRTGLAKTGDTVAVFPLVARLEQCDTFKTLEDVPLGARGADGA